MIIRNDWKCNSSLPAVQPMSKTYNTKFKKNQQLLLTLFVRVAKKFGKELYAPPKNINLLKTLYS